MDSSLGDAEKQAGSDPRLNDKYVTWALVALFNGALIGSIACIAVIVRTKPEATDSPRPPFVGMLVCLPLALGSFVGLMSYYAKMKKHKRFENDRLGAAAANSRSGPTGFSSAPTTDRTHRASYVSPLAHLNRQLGQLAHSARVHRFADDPGGQNISYASPAPSGYETAVAQHFETPGPATRVTVASSRSSDEKDKASDGSVEREWRRFQQQQSPAGTHLTVGKHTDARTEPPASIIAPRPLAVRQADDRAAHRTRRFELEEAAARRLRERRESTGSRLVRRHSAEDSRHLSTTPAPAIPEKSALRGSGRPWWGLLARKPSQHHSTPAPASRPDSVVRPPRISSLPDYQALVAELGPHPALARPTRVERSGAPSPESPPKRESPIDGYAAPRGRPRPDWYHGRNNSGGSRYSEPHEFAPLSPLPPRPSARLSQGAEVTATLGEIVDAAASEANPRTPARDLELAHEGSDRHGHSETSGRANVVRSSSSSEILDFAAARRRVLERLNYKPEGGANAEKAV